MPTGSSHLSFTMAALLAAGGLAGYIKKKSVPSLVAGCVLGALFTTGGYLISEGDARLGYDVSSSASVLLTAAMGARLWRTRKLMPAGALTVLGTVSSAYHISKSIEWRE